MNTKILNIIAITILVTGVVLVFINDAIALIFAALGMAIIAISIRLFKSSENGPFSLFIPTFAISYEPTKKEQIPLCIGFVMLLGPVLGLIVKIMYLKIIL